MKYFKNKDDIVASISPPMRVKPEAVPIETDGQVSYFPYDLESWEEVSSLVFRMYRAEKLDVLGSAKRDMQAGMWALNNGDDQVLRLGGNWPEDNQSVDFITSKDAKIALIERTQHWYKKDRPKTTESNSAWSKWIKRARKVEPFIYLG